MSTPHNEANLGDIAQTVIMPGDPLRAKYIAEKFLDNYKLVNSVRNIYAYTGNYKGTEVTIMASGMGMPSMGIYSYELFKFYDVQNIIRIGSCGALVPELNMFDIILSENVYSESNYAFTLNNDNCHIIQANTNLNNKILTSAEKNNIKIVKGNTICSDCFDLYMTDTKKFHERVPKGYNFLGIEMEAFALLYNAKLLNKNASCLMTVVDTSFKKAHASSDERLLDLDKMIKVALESL